MKKAKIIASAPQLIVTDVKRTVEFYKEKLGFEIIGLVGEPIVVYGMIQRDGFQIHFAKSRTGLIRNEKLIT